MTFKKFVAHWTRLLNNKDYRFSLFLSLIIWIGGYYLYKLAIDYVDRLNDVRTVRDLLLDTIPPLDMHFVYVYGIAASLLFLLFYILIFRPDMLPFGLKFYAAVFIVRSVFICLTHLGPPDGFFISAIAPDFNFWPFNHMMHANDLFFSGHVAYTYMGALLFKNTRWIFYLFLGISILMAFTVLALRIHYSIDVFAAYFIVFGLYAVTAKLFGRKDLSFHKLINI